MPPGFESLGSIAIYTPDLGRSLATYLALGLRPHDGEPAQLPSEGPTRVSLRFPRSDAVLVLHCDPQRQFVELNVDVDDVGGLYERLARDPDYTWLETPHADAGGWRAVVRLPDDNVFTLRSTRSVAAAPVSERAAAR